MRVIPAPGSPYRRAATMGSAIAVIMLSIAAFEVAVPPFGAFDQPDPCSKGGRGGTDGFTRQEALAYPVTRYDDSQVRVFPPARLCRVYGVSESVPAGPAEETLLGEDAYPEPWWYLATLVLAALPAVLVWWRRRLHRESPEAGWYPDPEDSAKWRYWSGRRWTTHRAPR